MPARPSARRRREPLIRAVRSARRLVAVAVSLVLAAACLVAVSQPAQAAGGGITFDEGYAADGARVDDQYRFVGDGGTTGIRFGGTRVDLGWPGETECGGSGAGDYRPTLRVLTGNGAFSFYAHSGARVLESASNNCTAGEFGKGGILFRCTIACLSVSGYVGLGNGTATPPTPPDGMTFTASAYDATGAAVASSPVALQSPGALTPFTLTAPASRSITFVKIVASGAVQSVLLDDLSYVVDPAALPTYVISTDTTTSVLRPGESATVPMSVVRGNGSSGTITPTVSGLPGGVTASFSPSAFTGTADGPLTLTLTASANAVVGDPVAVSVGATSDASAGSGTPATFSVHVVSTLQALADVPTLVAPPCTAQVRTLRIYVADGSSFTGQVQLSVSVDKPMWSVGVLASPLAVTNGRVDAAVWWRRDAYAAATKAGITVTATPVGRPNDSVSRTYQITNGSAAFAAKTVTARPPLGDRQLAQDLALTTYGMCAPIFLRFGNDKAVVPTTVTQAPLSSLPRDGTLNSQTMSVTTPRLATSGTLGYGQSEAGYFFGGPGLVVTGYRNTAGFPFTNYPVNDLTYQDMTDAFGKDQTYSSIDLCFPFGCNVTFRDPVAMIYTAMVRSWTVGTSGSGHCYGMSMTAALLRAGGLDPRTYLPYTSSQAFGLTGVNGPSAALARTIQANHLKQFGLTFLSYWLKQHVTNLLATSTTTVAAIRKAIDTGGGAMITIADKGGGHVVLAHSVEDLGGGEYWVDVYDPNWRHSPAEDSDTTGVEHEKRLNKSRLHLLGTTWSLEFPDGTVWNGSLRGASSLVVVPLSEASKRQVIPNLLDIKELVSLLGSMIGFGSTGGTATVTGGPGLLSYAPDNATTGGGLFFPAPAGTTSTTSKAATAPRPADDAVRIAATKAGAVNGLVISDGTLVATSLGLAPGTDVTVQKIVGGQRITTDTAVRTTVTTARAGATRLSTTATYVAPAGSSVSVAQSAAGLTVRTSARISLTMSIESRSSRSAGTTRTVTVTVPARGTLAVSTRALAGASKVLAVSLNGRSVALPATRRVAGTVTIGTVSTRRSGTTLTVSANVTVKAAPGAAGTVVMVLTKAGKVVATKRIVVSARAARRGTTVTYTWRLTAIRGVTLTVVASVAPRSGGAGLVSTSRTTTTR